MLKYVSAALALKTFSLNPWTKKLYRFIGNTIGERNRLAVDDLEIRIERGKLLVELCKKYGVIQDNHRVLEIGTGWMHWYSLFLRLHFDIQVSAMDIWDNRQFRALQAAMQKLKMHEYVTKTRLPLIRDKVEKILECSDFEELYEAMNYEYLLDPNGKLSGMANSSFDLVMSMHVLEHVPHETIDRLLQEVYQKLRPGSFTVHQIGVNDHLSHYDHTASPKQYLKYSDRKWRLCFENEVQYFNRLQTSDWLSKFSSAGFQLQEVLPENQDIGPLKIDPRFEAYSKEELQCVTLTLVHRKPS